MSDAPYAERLAFYVESLPSETKTRLLVKVAVRVFGARGGSGPERLNAFAETLTELSDLDPELHQHYDRQALTDSLGDYIVEWWGEVLDRPLTGKDLDQLVDELPDSGVREALKRFSERRKDDR
jgi:hypothetical protein